MTEIVDLIKAVNEIIETCRSHPFCDCCPYQDKFDGSCIIYRETKTENVPEMWLKSIDKLKKMCYNKV